MGGRWEKTGDGEGEERGEKTGDGSCAASGPCARVPGGEEQHADCAAILQSSLHRVAGPRSSGNALSDELKRAISKDMLSGLEPMPGSHLTLALDAMEMGDGRWSLASIVN